jgi:hypothetical protein
MLFKKIYGAIAAGNVYASMGEFPRRMGKNKGYNPFEGYLGEYESIHYKAIEKDFGRIETLLPRTAISKPWRIPNGPMAGGDEDHNYPAGMTEDGAERRFILIKALIDKNGRINAEDLQDAWLKYIKPEVFGYLMTHRDKHNYENMKKYPAREVGRYERWPGGINVGMMIGPIRFVNACNPKQAALDAVDVCSCIQSPYISSAPFSAASLAAAVSEGMKPDATVDSMVEAAIKFCGEKNVEEVIQEGIDLAKKYSNVFDIREPFYQKFGGRNAIDSL